MATSQTLNKLKAELAAYTYIHTGTAAATDTAWIDMRDFEKLLVLVSVAALTGTGLTAFSILGNTSSTGSGTDRVIKAHALGSLPNAVADFVCLEITAEELAQVGSDNGEDLRYVSANLTMDNNADVMAVTYIKVPGRFTMSGLTADLVS